MALIGEIDIRFLCPPILVLFVQVIQLGTLVFLIEPYRPSLVSSILPDSEKSHYATIGRLTHVL